MTGLRGISAVAASAVVLLVAPGAASALTQTDLDSTFGSGGIVATGAVLDEPGTPVAVQPDGKILLGYEAAGHVPRVMRLNPDGTPDASFGVAGTVSLNPLTGTEFAIRRVLVGGTGTIYVVGNVNTGVPQAAVWALTPNGAPETAFNVTGSRLFPVFGAAGNGIGDAAMTPDGKVAFAMAADLAGDGVVALRVVTPAGVIHASNFHGNVGEDYSPTSIMVQPDGRIVVGAARAVASGLLGMLVGFTSIGALDGAFGTAGESLFGPLIPLLSYPVRLFNWNGGFAGVGNVGYNVAFANLASDGTPNPALAPFYAVRLLPYGATFATSSDGAAAAGGRAIGVGAAAIGGSSTPPFLFRFNADTTPDSSFAPGGFAFLPTREVINSSIAVQPDGKYIVAGEGAGDTVNLLRVWGDHPAPQPVVTAFAASLKSKMSVRKGRSFKGTTSGTGVTSVDVAIQKVESKLLKKSKRCSYVRSTKATLKSVKAVAGKCVPSVWLRAKGTSRWSLRMTRSLRPGKYVVSARATGFLGIGATIKKSITLTK